MGTTRTGASWGDVPGAPHLETTAHCADTPGAPHLGTMAHCADTPGGPHLGTMMHWCGRPGSTTPGDHGALAHLVRLRGEKSMHRNPNHEGHPNILRIKVPAFCHSAVSLAPAHGREGSSTSLHHTPWNPLGHTLLHFGCSPGRLVNQARQCGANKSHAESGPWDPRFPSSLVTAQVHPGPLCPRSP